MMLISHEPRQLPGASELKYQVSFEYLSVRSLRFQFASASTTEARSVDEISRNQFYFWI